MTQKWCYDTFSVTLKVEEGAVPRGNSTKLQRGKSITFTAVSYNKTNSMFT